MIATWSEVVLGEFLGACARELTSPHGGEGLTAWSKRLTSPDFYWELISLLDKTLIAQSIGGEFTEQAGDRENKDVDPDMDYMASWQWYWMATIVKISQALKRQETPEACVAAQCSAKDSGISTSFPALLWPLPDEVPTQLRESSLLHEAIPLLSQMFFQELSDKLTSSRTVPKQTEATVTQFPIVFPKNSTRAMLRPKPTQTLLFRVEDTSLKGFDIFPDPSQVLLRAFSGDFLRTYEFAREAMEQYWNADADKENLLKKILRPVRVRIASRRETNRGQDVEYPILLKGRSGSGALLRAIMRHFRGDARTFDRNVWVTLDITEEGAGQRVSTRAWPVHGEFDKLDEVAMHRVMGGAPPILLVAERDGSEAELAVLQDKIRHQVTLRTIKTLDELALNEQFIPGQRELLSDGAGSDPENKIGGDAKEQETENKPERDRLHRNFFLPRNPPEPTPFFRGREFDRLGLMDALSEQEPRIVVMHGARGSGKSHLFYSICPELYHPQSGWDGGVIIDFDETRAADSWQNTLIDEFRRMLPAFRREVLPDSWEKKIELLLSVLRTVPRRYLLVLENFENMLDPKSYGLRPDSTGIAILRLLRQLTQEKDNSLRILILSKVEPKFASRDLQAGDAFEDIPVPGLDEEVAMILLRDMEDDNDDRLRKARRSVIKSLVRRVHCLPRGIEALAGRLRLKPTLSPESLMRTVTQTDNPERFLTQEAKRHFESLPRNQQTLSLLLAALRRPSTITVIHNAWNQYLNKRTTERKTFELLRALTRCYFVSYDGTNQTYYLLPHYLDTLTAHLEDQKAEPLTGQIYTVVASIYAEMLAETVGGDTEEFIPGTFGVSAGYWLENPKQRANTAEWFRALSFAVPDEARLQFGSLILEAFYWEGDLMTPTPMPMWMKEWRSSHLHTEAPRMADLLQDLDDIYPREGFVTTSKLPPSIRKRWVQVIAILREIATILHCTDSVDESHPRRLLANAALRGYEATALAAIQEDAKEVRELACQLLAKSDRLSYGVAYERTEQALVFVEKRRLKDAIREVQQAWEVRDNGSEESGEITDREIEARILGAAGDVYLKLGNAAHGLSCWAWAIQTLYLYMWTQSPMLDDYTCDKYAEFTYQISKRLRDEFGADKEATLAVCQQIRGIWSMARGEEAMPPWDALAIRALLSAPQPGYREMDGLYGLLFPHIPPTYPRDIRKELHPKPVDFAYPPEFSNYKEFDRAMLVEVDKLVSELAIP